MGGDDSKDVDRVDDNGEEVGNVARTEEDNDRGDAMNCDCELVVDSKPELGPTPAYIGEDDIVIALLVAVLSENSATRLVEDVVAGGDNEVFDARNTVAVAITDVSVEAGAKLAVSVVNKLNCLEKDVVEVLDKEARSIGGFPGAFGIAGTEPICLLVGWFEVPASVTEGAGEIVRSEEDEGMMDAVKTDVRFPVATACATRLVGIARGLEDTSASRVKLCTGLPEARYASDDKEEVYIKEVEGEASTAMEGIDDCTASSGTID